MKKNKLKPNDAELAERAEGRNRGGLAPTPHELTMLKALFNQDRLVEAEQFAYALTLRFPQHGLGWKILAAVLGRLGHNAAALRPARIAAELLPKDADTHHVLGLALNQLGQPIEAEASFRRAVKIKPGFAAAQYHLANALIMQGRWIEAEAGYRRALQINRNCAGAHYNLGNTLYEQSRLAEAVASFRSAIKLVPDFVDAHCNLGNALTDQGKLADAEACFRRALEIDPGHAGAHYNLGLILYQQGRWVEAEASFRESLKIKPDFVDAHCNLGTILKAHGQLIEAQACFRQALQISPGFVDAHCALGHTLNEQGRLSEAEICYQKALEIRPDSADAFVGLGEAAAGQGRFADAEDLYARALEINPQMCTAWAALAHIRKMTVHDADWMANAEKLLQRRLCPREESFLRYAMGKYCNDVQNFDDAFQNYFRANELIKTFGRRYDRQQQALVVDQLCQAYPLETVRRAHAGASESVRPLFIVGMPRSGTSLIEQIIASHPATFGAGELGFWGDVLEQHSVAVFAAQLDETLISKLVDDCLRNLSSFSADALRVVDKMPVNFCVLGLIHAVFPNARIIHAQRNPVDTCLSIYFQNFNAGYAYANDLGDLAHYYREYFRLMAHWRATLPPEILLDVRYEALVDDQEGWSHRIIDFIGLDWDERCLEFHKTERKVTTSSKWQVRQAIYRTSKERWRNYEKFAGPLLELMRLDSEKSAGADTVKG